MITDFRLMSHAAEYQQCSRLLKRLPAPPPPAASGGWASVRTWRWDSRSGRFCGSGPGQVVTDRITHTAVESVRSLQLRYEPQSRRAGNIIEKLAAFDRQVEESLGPEGDFRGSASALRTPIWQERSGHDLNQATRCVVPERQPPDFATLARRMAAARSC